MPTLKNPRQEKFCQLILVGNKPGYVCYTEAGYKAKTVESARANAARLIASEVVKNRIQELRGPIAAAIERDLSVTTTQVAKHLWDLSTYDLAQVFDPVSVGRGRQRRTVLMLKEPSKLPSWWGKIAEGARVKPDGTIELMWPDRRLPAVKVGEHLGMFQGESAGPIQGNVTNNTMVFVDAPPPETLEQWKARIERERGIKQLAPR